MMAREMQIDSVRVCMLGDCQALEKIAVEAAPRDCNGPEMQCSQGPNAFDVNRMFPGLQKTLLHLACERGHKNVAQYLVGLGGDPEVKDQVSGPSLGQPTVPCLFFPSTLYLKSSILLRLCPGMLTAWKGRPGSDLGPCCRLADNSGER